MDKSRGYVLCGLRTGISITPGAVYFPADRWEFHYAWCDVRDPRSRGIYQGLDLPSVPVSEGRLISSPWLQINSNSIGSGACPWRAAVAAVPLPGDHIWPATDSYASAGRQWFCSCIAASASRSNNFQRPAPRTSINSVEFPDLCGLKHTTKRREIPNDLLENKCPLWYQDSRP